MRLLEYRFPELARGAIEQIAHTLASIFESNADTDLALVYSELSEGGQLRQKRLLVDNVAAALADSIVASHSAMSAELAKLVAVKSTRTCRFVAVEMDGLVRMRLAQDDCVPDTGGWGVTARDVSQLLTSTDVYDYM
jgi:hypothetical protein